MNRTLLLIALAVAAAPASAQVRYLPQTDTLYYEALNPYHMYVVRGGDTLGGPVRSLNVERHIWRESEAGLRAEVHVDAPGGGEPPVADVLDVSPGGTVTGIRQGDEDHRGRWDFVLRLPADGDLHPGRVWHDTLSRTGEPGGENGYQVWRELRVERIVDTLGSRIAIVCGTGTLRYRDAYPLNQGGEWWIDVSGPTRETFLFDLTHGRTAGREWWMDLRGIAGFPRAGGAVDTIPAGLLSSDTTRLVTAARARLLLRGLPPGDTTESTGSMAFVHTVRKEGGGVESGFVRPDGMLTTVRASYRDGLTTRYEMLSTEGLKEPVRRTVVAEDGRLRVSGGRDTVMPLPEGSWTVADYAMHEHLAPALARLAAEGEERAALMVYRPYPLHWDTVDVTVQPVTDEVLLAIVRGDDVLELMLLEKDGTLLYVERVEPHAYQRRPRSGTREAKRVETLLAAVIRLFDAK